MCVCVCVSVCVCESVCGEKEREKEREFYLRLFKVYIVYSTKNVYLH